MDLDLALQRYQLHRPHNAPLFTAPAVWTVMLAIAGNHHPLQRCEGGDAAAVVTSCLPAIRTGPYRSRTARITIAAKFR